MDCALEKDMSRGSESVEWDAALDGEKKVGTGEYLAVDDGDKFGIGLVGGKKDLVVGSEVGESCDKVFGKEDKFGTGKNMVVVGGVGKSHDRLGGNEDLAVVGEVGNSHDRLGGNDTLLQPEKDKIGCEMLKL